MRTRVTSIATATASPRPKTFKMWRGSFTTKDPKTQNMIAAAAVMIRHSPLVNTPSWISPSSGGAPAGSDHDHSGRRGMGGERR